MFGNIHEECGVFGIFDPSKLLNVTQITYSGLYALQHRGQQSCGIAVNNDRGSATHAFHRHLAKSLIKGGIQTNICHGIVLGKGIGITDGRNVNHIFRQRNRSFSNSDNGPVLWHTLRNGIDFIKAFLFAERKSHN